MASQDNTVVFLMCRETRPTHQCARSKNIYVKLEDYNERAATVTFVTNITFENLDDHCQKVSKSTWTRNETLALFGDNDELAESKNISDDGSWIYYLSNETGNNHGVTAASTDTGSPSHIITSLHSDIVYMRHWMIRVDHIVDDVTRCTQEEAWENRVLAPRMTVKDNFWMHYVSPFRRTS